MCATGPPKLRQAIRGRNVVLWMWSCVSHARRLLPVPGSRVCSRAPAKSSTMVALKRQRKEIAVTTVSQRRDVNRSQILQTATAHASWPVSCLIDLRGGAPVSPSSFSGCPETRPDAGAHAAQPRNAQGKADQPLVVLVETRPRHPSCAHCGPARRTMTIQSGFLFGIPLRS